MKCYVHHEADAVGVCSECGQGVCDICAVRIGGRLYCKSDADRVFSMKSGVGDVLEVGGSKFGMILTLLGGCVYLFLGVLATYAFLVGFAATSTAVYAGSVEVSAVLHGAAYLVVGMITTSIGVLLGGAYLNSDEHSRRVQGGAISITSAVIGLLVVLALPFAVFPGGSPNLFYAAAAGASVTVFIIEFGGFVFVLVGGALGMTRK